MATARGHGDKIFSICFSPASGHTPSLVTCGVKHIKFWSVCGNSLSGKKGIFGKKGKYMYIFIVVTASVSMMRSLHTGVYNRVTDILESCHIIARRHE